MSEAVLAEPIGQIIENALFASSDPCVQRLRKQWEQTKREVNELFETCCREHYESRLQYHRSCQELAPALLAANDLTLFRVGLAQEREERLAGIWITTAARVQVILADQEEA